MVSGAHCWEPLKSCFLSAFSPEPKDKPGLGEALACLEQTAARTTRAGEWAAPSPPQSPRFRFRGASFRRELPSVSSGACPHLACRVTFYFLGFCQSQKIGKQLGSRGLGVEFEQ